MTATLSCKPLTGRRAIRLPRNFGLFTVTDAGHGPMSPRSQRKTPKSRLKIRYMNTGGGDVIDQVKRSISNTTSGPWRTGSTSRYSVIELWLAQGERKKRDRFCLQEGMEEGGQGRDSQSSWIARPRLEGFCVVWDHTKPPHLHVHTCMFNHGTTDLLPVIFV